MSEFDNFRPMVPARRKDSLLPAMVAFALMLLIAFGIWYLSYGKAYFAKQELKGYLQGIDEMAQPYVAAAERDSQRQVQISAQQAQARRYEADRRAAQAALDAETERQRRTVESVAGCAASADRKTCRCYDAQADTVPGITVDECLQAVGKGLSWIREARSVDSTRARLVVE